MRYYYITMLLLLYYCSCPCFCSSCYYSGCLEWGGVPQADLEIALALVIGQVLQIRLGSMHTPRLRLGVMDARGPHLASGLPTRLHFSGYSVASGKLNRLRRLCHAVRSRCRIRRDFDPDLRNFHELRSDDCDPDGDGVVVVLLKLPLDEAWADDATEGLYEACSKTCLRRPRLSPFFKPMLRKACRACRMASARTFSASISRSERGERTGLASLLEPSDSDMLPRC